MKKLKFNRRNWIRFFSLTGVSTLMSWQNPVDPDCPTTPDIEGPFYLPGSPFIPKLAPDGAAGTPLFITGTVFANDCTTPVANAVVDVWHANDGGDYEDSHYRGKVTTDWSGHYAFQTILPGKYLNGAQFRPRHFHYKVSAMDHELTTQIYFEGDTSIPIDPWASTPEAEDRIISLTSDNEGQMHGVADIYLDVMPVINSTNPNRSGNNGSFIEHLFPNPVSTEARVLVNLDRSTTLGLEVFDLNGRLIKYISRGIRLNTGAHSFPFNANNDLGIKMSSGIYILRMTLDGQPAHAKRFVVT